MSKTKYKLGDILTLPVNGKGNGGRNMEETGEVVGSETPCGSEGPNGLKSCEVVWTRVLDAINVQGSVLKAQGETLTAQGEILKQQGEILRSCQDRLKNMYKLEAAYDFLKLEVQRNNGEVSEWARRCATRCETLHTLLEHHLNGKEKDELDEKDPPPTLDDVEREDLRRTQTDG